MINYINYSQSPNSVGVQYVNIFKYMSSPIDFNGTICVLKVLHMLYWGGIATEENCYIN